MKVRDGIVYNLNRDHAFLDMLMRTLTPEQKKLLESYLKLAEENQLYSIAFPCISTGVYHYPHEAAAKIALNTIFRHIENGSYKGYVILCCFLEEDARIYERLLNTHLEKHN